MAAAGTVISGGFPGRVAQEVQPNPKCHGCLHYDGQAGRTGACTIGLRPWLCGDGGAAEIGYAPITHGAGAYLPDMSNHGVHAREVETQFVSDLYGSGSTKPVTVQTVSLGDEAVGFIKSMVDQHMEMERSVCRLCKSIGTTIGATPYTNGPQVCTCEPIKATEVAKALVGRMSNRQRASMTLDDVIEFVYDVAKAGYKVPKKKDKKEAKGSNNKGSDKLDPMQVEKAISWTHHDDGIRAATPHGKYLVTHTHDEHPGPDAPHTVKFWHASDKGNKPSGEGVFPSRKAAKQEVQVHHRGLQERAKTSLVSKSIMKAAEAIDKSYGDDWLCQFKGTPLFPLAHKLCEQELAMREAQITRREERAKHDKARSTALAKLEKPGGYDWEAEDAMRQRLDIAKQRLSLKLAEHQQKTMSKSLSKADHPSNLKVGDMVVHSGGSVGFHHPDPKVAATHSQIGVVHSIRQNPSTGEHHVSVKSPNASSGKYHPPQSLTQYDSVRHPTHEDMQHHHKMLTKFANKRAKLKNAPPATQG